jgi:hypothetical protein
MTTAVNNNAAAVETTPQHKEIENYTDAERTEWLKTGKPAFEEVKKDSPVKKDGTQAADNTPVKKTDSGPVKQEPSAEDKEAEKQLNFKALRERTERLEAELEEFRTGKKKAEDKKPDAASAAPKLLELPKRPKMTEFMKDGALDSEKYETALDQYEDAKTAYTNQQVQIRTASAQREEFAKTWQAEIKTIYGKEISAEDIHKVVGKLADTQQTSPAVFVQLNSSKYFPHLVQVFQGDPALLDNFIKQANDPKTFPDAVRALFGMERDIEAELAKKADKGADDGKERPLTKAGKPPSEASGAASSPADDGSADAAWRRKDLSAAERGELYRERKNKEERAKRKKPN